MAFDVEAIRGDFPILERKLPNGKQLVYFDNAATSQKPKCVIDAMSRYYEEYNSNAHRANHTLADEATAALEEARRRRSRTRTATRSGAHHLRVYKGATSILWLTPCSERSIDGGAW